MYGNFVAALGKKDDKYGFVNETEIRVATGLSLLLGIYSFVNIVFLANFSLSMYFIGLIWIDFVLKVFVSPEISPFARVVRPFLSLFSEKKIWVGSVQKRFAWSIGLFLSTFVVWCVLIISGTLNDAGILTDVYQQYLAFPIKAPMMIPMNPAIVACLLCLIFMTLESVFGYCVGCKMYEKLVQKGFMKEISGQICPGGVCKI